MPSSDITNIINNLTIQDIAIIILIVVVVYLLFRSNSCSENFDTNDSNTDALQNLGKISKEIMTTNGTLTIPANTIKMSGNLIVDGEITFTSKNTKTMNIFPQFMVIAWANTIIPKGWAMCDGNMYTLDVNGDAVITPGGIQSPDLRGRFILGSGDGAYLTARKINDVGGEENHTLIISEIPSHSHAVTNVNSVGGAWGTLGYDGGGWMNNVPTSSGYTGGNSAHNNMPPFYSLMYIMKL